jgi:UDP-N-acetylglucosamine 4,6-dehydratase
MPSAPLSSSLNVFDNAVLLITGGTGSFGNAVVKRFLATGVREIRVFSRDEKKQEDMRTQYSDPRLKFYIGDVRDKESLLHAMHGVDFVFAAAALKQVPSCEFYPMEAYKTNVVGNLHVIEAAAHHGVRKVIFLSTDKAVYPVNAMGLSKAMMEKVFVAASRDVAPGRTTVCGTRYGNVMGSRGSVIPLFVNQMMAGEPITVTDPRMTRFMMTMDEAIELVLYAFEHGRSGDLFVRKAPSATLETLVRAMLNLFEKPGHPVRIIGTRHGEKLHETLLSREERIRSEDLGPYVCIPADLRDLNYGKFTVSGEARISECEDYTSENTERLDVAAMEALLLKLDFIRDALAGNAVEPGY